MGALSWIITFELGFKFLSFEIDPLEAEAGDGFAYESGRMPLILLLAFEPAVSLPFVSPGVDWS
jgi:hypothetical protein